MKKVLITEFMEKESVDLLASKFEVKYNPKLSDNIENLINEIDLYDGLIVRNKTLVNELVLSKAINLKFIGRLGVGLDNIDMEQAKKQNIQVFRRIKRSITCRNIS